MAAQLRPLPPRYAPARSMHTSALMPLACLRTRRPYSMIIQASLDPFSPLRFGIIGLAFAWEEVISHFALSEPFCTTATAPSLAARMHPC